MLNIKTENTMTTIKTQSAQSLGTYKATELDNQKTNVDFLITQVAPFYIRWSNGEGQTVTERKLNQLKKTHTWATDF
jgi:hypothetical protein